MKKHLALILALAMVLCSMISVLTVSAAGPYTDTSKWTLTVSSDKGNTAGKLIDGNTATYWHSNYTAEGGTITSHDECPHTIELTFPSAIEISAVRYIPRQKAENDGSTAGIWKTAEIYGSTDGKEYTKLADATYDVGGSRAATDTPIKQAKYKGIKVIVTASENGYGTGAELQMIDPNGKEGGTATTAAKTETKTETKPAAAPQDNSLTHAPCPEPVANVTAMGTRVVGEQISTNGLSIKPSSVSGNQNGTMMLDGDLNTVWHSNYTASGSTITSHDVSPFCVDVDLGEKKVISGFGYTPRQNNTNGYWKNIQVLSSTDGKKYTPICNDVYEYTGTDNSMKFTGFGRNVTAKYLRIIIVEAANYCMAAEFHLFGPLASATASGEGASVFRKQTSTTADAAPGSGKIVFTMNNTSASANGATTTLPVAPSIMGGATMLPLKYTVESLGGSYAENGDEITVTYNNANYVLKKNNNYLAVNGLRALMARPTVDVNGTVLASVLLFTNNFGVKAELNQAQQAIILKK